MARKKLLKNWKKGNKKTKECKRLQKVETAEKGSQVKIDRFTSDDDRSKEYLKMGIRRNSKAFMRLCLNEYFDEKIMNEKDRHYQFGIINSKNYLYMLLIEKGLRSLMDHISNYENLIISDFSKNLYKNLYVFLKDKKVF